MYVKILLMPYIYQNTIYMYIIHNTIVKEINYLVGTLQMGAIRDKIYF